MSSPSACPEVVFPDLDLRVHAGVEETLLSCIRRVGLNVDSTCNGRGKCGKCLVMAQGDLTPPDEAEMEHLVGQPPNVRLACCARVVGHARVALFDRWYQLKSTLGREVWDIPLDSAVSRVDLPPMESESSRPYVESLPLRVRDPDLLNRLAQWNGNPDNVSGIAFDEELIDLVPRREPILGAALDIGTTSLSLTLYDLEHGTSLGRSSALNPQAAYGGDVVTRIGYCRQDPEGLATLQAAVNRGLGAMMDEALGTSHTRDQVHLMMVAANTTMLHILAGVSPLSLAISPFRPLFLKLLAVDGQRLGLPINPRGRCIMLPGASAYVGADIVAGLMSVDLPESGMTLFIDIGTNGEIVILDGRDPILATSCAMGPALEGMNIACGCRAVPGAVDSFSLQGDLSPQFTTIEDEPPAGICGSGLLDLVAALLEAGLITSSGAFNPKADERLLQRMKDSRYHLTDQVFLSQKDIRQVQLARGAILTGIQILLKEAGCTVHNLVQIVVAGSFGYHLKAESLESVGFLPRASRCPITYVGNSSLTGASLALLNQRVLRKMQRTASQIRVVELGSHPDFKKLFTSNLSF